VAREASPGRVSANVPDGCEVTSALPDDLGHGPAEKRSKSDPGEHRRNEAGTLVDPNEYDPND